MNILIVSDARIIPAEDGYQLVGSAGDLVTDIYVDDTSNRLIDRITSLLNVPLQCTCIYSHDFSGEYTIVTGSVTLTVNVYNRLENVVVH